MFLLHCRGVAGRQRRPATIEPDHPFHDGLLHRIEGSPGSEWMDNPGLEQTNEGIDKRFVMRIPRADNGRPVTGLCDAFGIAITGYWQPLSP